MLKLTNVKVLSICILTVCLFLPSSVFSQSPAKKLEKELSLYPDDYVKQMEIISKTIDGFTPLTETCGTEKRYKELFELAPLIRGAHSSEHLGEINTLAIIKCPENYLLALQTAKEEEIEKTVSLIGIAPPPWEAAEKIFPYLDKPELKSLIDKYFRKWVLECTHPDGKAKINCNFSEQGSH